MKKSTLIVVVLAIALGAFVYFYDSKHSVAPATDEASWKPAFAVSADQIAGLTLVSGTGKTVFAKQGKDWRITRPVPTRADQASISGIVNDLSSAKIRRSFAPTDSLSKYGLAQPAVTIDFQQKGGAEHTIRLGDKDFSGNVVYALIDASKNVDMLPVSLLDETDKPLSQLRDRSVLGLNDGEITGITIDDPSGTIAVTKKNSTWEIVKPKAALADSSTVDSLASALTTDKFTDVVSESPDDLAKYGLTHPSMSVTAATKGQESHLLIGKKNGDSYYARDAARPMIFEISSTVYDTLNKKFFDLRDKSILQFDPANVATVEIHNASGIIQCTQGKDDQWTIVQPAADKGKAIQSWKILDPIQNARAKEIYDTPSQTVLTHLAKPEIEVILTDKAGKKTTVDISAAAGDSVYVRTTAGPEAYDLNTQILKDLGFKAADLLM
ncbi:MAG: DUF4340 domain-containing protein [Candidatus Acidiferrales bacterium]|jgi:hypothetical protein|nr:DUF4340 domain-containing protein [Candidatus Acidoferrales bacterium]